MKTGEWGFVGSGLVATSLVCGCSTTATISRVDGPEVDAKIEAADEENIYVRTAGGVHPIPRKKVTDIDHPGDTAAGIGSGILGYGVFNIAVGWELCKDRNSSDKAAFCIGVFTPALLGLSMLGWGLAVHADSTQALEKRPRIRESRTGPLFLPVPVAGSTGAGLGLVMSY